MHAHICHGCCVQFAGRVVVVDQDPEPPAVAAVLELPPDDLSSTHDVLGMARGVRLRHELASFESNEPRPVIIRPLVVRPPRGKV